MKTDKMNICGVYFDSVNYEEALSFMFQKIDSGGVCTVFTPNSEIVQCCRHDEQLRGVINSADLTVPDGAGVILASKILSTPLSKGKVAGVELGELIAKRCAELEKSLFIFGGQPGVAARAAELLALKYSGLKIAGTCNGFDEYESALSRITESSPDAVFVCLGSPKQELWISRFKDEIKSGILIGLGGSADIYSARVKRAPRIFIRSGFEWLWRLLKKPARIKRMIKIPAFLVAALLQRAALRQRIREKRD